MNSIYKVLNLTKQAFHQRVELQIRREEELEQLLCMIREIRTDHPCMSAREMYFMIQPQTVGRDRFELFCHQRGFKLEVKRSFRRTTNSLGVTRFNNLILNRELKGINQVFVSDITYYAIEGRFYYLTFLMDLFSRRIVGHSASDNLFTENTTIPALKMALKARKGANLSNLILHSDGGGQYYSKDFLKLTKQAGIKNSMCESVYENAHAERINGTIKNAYLEGYSPQNFQELNKMLTKAVYMYNYQKPHKALKRLSPVRFENRLPERSTRNQVANKRKKEAKKEKIITTIDLCL